MNKLKKNIQSKKMTKGEKIRKRKKQRTQK